IIASSAEELVVAAVAIDHVGIGVARAVDVAIAGKGQVFNESSELVRLAGLDRVDAPGRSFDDHVTRGNNIGVVTIKPRESVDTCTALDTVCQLVPRTGKGAGAGEGQVFDIR